MASLAGGVGGAEGTKPLRLSMEEVVKYGKCVRIMGKYVETRATHEIPG
jgi:hypothetical protein